MRWRENSQRKEKNKMSYPLYPARDIVPLDGIWDFTLLEGETASRMQENAFRGLEFSDLQSVPGCFDAGPRYAGRRGIGVYRKRFHLRQGGRYLLKCGGLGLTAQIFIDGREIESSEFPYSAFTRIFHLAEAGTHEIVFAVDNRFHSEDNGALFRPNYDFYAYGGIYRNVELQKLPERYAIDRCHVLTRDWRTGKVVLNVFLADQEDFQGPLTVSIAFDDEGEGVTETLFFHAGRGAVSGELSVPDFKVWSPERPALHTVRIRTETDCIIERFGIREIKTEGTRLLLNGEPLKLLGYNRHESHPEFGPALPQALMIEDLQILRDMHCNFIRGCHYPQNQDFLDLCDQYGFLVWEEGLAWGNPPENLTDSSFQEKQIRQTRKMIHNSFNHPSVILFGFLNEMHSFDPQARELTEKLVREIRRLDPTRPVTFATAFIDDDKVLDLLDVISTNLYPGWYGCGYEDASPADKIEPRLNEVAARIDSGEDTRNKPWIISEIGAAGLFGCHDRLKGQWSEEYQADYLRRVCRYVLDHSRVCGLALWQFTDCRTYSCSPHLNRARGFNNKGSLDEYRRPKMAFDAVREVFSSWKEQKEED